VCVCILRRICVAMRVAVCVVMCVAICAAGCIACGCVYVDVCSMYVHAHVRSYTQSSSTVCCVHCSAACSVLWCIVLQRAAACCKV